MRLIVTPNCQLPSPYGLYGDSKYLKSNRQWEHAYRSRLDVVRRNWPVDVNLNTRFVAIVDTRDANERSRAAITASGNVDLGARNLKLSRLDVEFILRIKF